MLHAGLEKVVQTLHVVCMDELHHSLGEDRGAVGVEHVSERHLRRLVFVEPDLRVVYELDVLKLRLLLEDNLGRPHGRVRSHLQAAQTTRGA